MPEMKMLTTDEVADILGVNRRTVQRLCQERKIKYRRTTPKKIEIAQEWLDEYIKSVTFDPKQEKENENNE